MKANGLNGEYCQSCASILDDVQRNYRRVIVVDSQCAAVFSQSGDAALLDERVRASKQEVASVPKAEPKAERLAPHKIEHKSTSKKR